MNRLKLLLILLSFPYVFGKPNQGYDLEPDAPIRIGVKKRAKKCETKSVTGDRLSVHYTGKLYKDGKEFDSSITRGDPLNFRIGKGDVIEGWDRGLLNMCIGEKRRLTIPSDMAYGNTGAPPDIHPGATLVFEIILMDILEPSGEDDDINYVRSHFEF